MSFEYTIPPDVKELLRTTSVMSKTFSILLLKKRSKSMDKEDFDRAMRTIKALRFNTPFR